MTGVGAPDGVSEGPQGSGVRDESTVPSPSRLHTELMKSFTARCDDWTVWKNTERSLAGLGDIDSAAPADRWDDLEYGFHIFSLDHGLRPLPACRHIPGTLILTATAEGTRRLIEVDIVDVMSFRGVDLFSAVALRPLTVEERGIRHLRPGAEGLLQLLTAVVGHLGSPHLDSLYGRRIRSDLMIDARGVEAAATHLLPQPSRALALRLVDEVVDGRWSKPLGLAIELEAVARSLAHPQAAVSRLRHRATRRRCPIAQAAESDRTILGPMDAWHYAVKSWHPESPIVSPGRPWPGA